MIEILNTFDLESIRDCMNGSTVAGTIIWNDNRNGMFQQILVMPFNKIQYVIANLITLILIGLASVVAINDNRLLNNISTCELYIVEHTLHLVRISSGLNILWFFYDNSINKNEK